MDIDRVRYFSVFAETGSLVAASEVLHVSQPALSKALRILEKEIGVKLMEPDGRGLRMTAAGKNFHTESSELLGKWFGLQTKLKGQTVATPTRLGSFEVFTTYFLNHLFKYVDLNNLEIHEYGPGKLEQEIATCHVDIGITYLPVPQTGVDFTEVTRIKMGVFGAEQFQEKTFVTLPFVVPLFPAEGTPSKVMGLDGWPDHKFERSINFRVTMMESAMALCRSGKAVAYLPEFVVRLHNENVLPSKRLLEIPSPIPQKDQMQSVFLIKRKGHGETALYRKIAQSLRAL